MTEKEMKVTIYAYVEPLFKYGFYIKHETQCLTVLVDPSKNHDWFSIRLPHILDNAENGDYLDKRQGIYVAVGTYNNKYGIAIETFDTEGVVLNWWFVELDDPMSYKKVFDIVMNNFFEQRKMKKEQLNKAVSALKLMLDHLGDPCQYGLLDGDKTKPNP